MCVVVLFVIEREIESVCGGGVCVIEREIEREIESVCTMNGICDPS